MKPHFQKAFKGESVATESQSNGKLIRARNLAEPYLVDLNPLVAAMGVWHASVLVESIGTAIESCEKAELKMKECVGVRPEV